MKIIEGKDAIVGRVAAYAAKEALKGEDIAIVNCEQMIISGNKKDIKQDFEAKRSRVGSAQKGQKIPRVSEKIVKRAVRGMLPNYRNGRGKAAYRKVMCYKGVPAEFEGKERLTIGELRTGTKIGIKVKELEK